jgi:hypothetical protein
MELRRGAMRRIVAVTVLQGHRLQIVFDNGIAGTVDLSDLCGKGVFSLWMDRTMFESVQIGSSGELIWGDRIDLCPDALYFRATGKRPEDVFLALRQQASHA